jgi:hypothetical protein
VPQLKSHEQRELFSILVEHLDPAQLARVLKHNGLPEIEELAGNGNHRDRTEEVVDELSKRFRIVELVEGAIGELDGSCPPLQSWIEKTRDELIRRRDEPSVIERIGGTFRGVQNLRTCMVLSIIMSLSIVVIIVILIYIRPDTSIVKSIDMSNAHSTTINKSISPSVVSEVERRPLSKEEITRHARRAFFIESFASLIHPELVPAVFEEIRKLGHAEFDSTVETELVSQYEGLKGVKLEWLRNVVVDKLLEIKATQGASQSVESPFLLPAQIRLSDEDRVVVELESARDEVEFIYGKLNGANLEDAIVDTFVRGTMNNFLREVTVKFEGSTSNPEDATRFVKRAVFPNLGLFGNSRSCLEQSLHRAQMKYPWMAATVPNVSHQFPELTQARIQWINRALNELETNTGPVEVRVPDSLSISLEGATLFNVLSASPNDRRSLERELELLTLFGTNDGRASTSGNESAFSRVIVRFAAVNILREFRRSTKQ